MTAEHPQAGRSAVSAALEHVASALELQQDLVSRDARAGLVADLRADADSGAARAARALLAGDADAAGFALRAPVDEIAAALDALAEPQEPAQVDPETERLPLAAADGPVALWRHELRRLARRSGRRAADIALSMSRRGFSEPVLEVPVVLADPSLAESTVDELGGKWVEGSYRSLYRAARREWTCRTDVDRVERGVSGLNAVNSPTPDFAAQQLRVPGQELPPVRGRDAQIEEALAALDVPEGPVRVLTGPAGYGKTTVALAIAARAEAAGRLALWMPAHDGQALVEGLELAAVRTGATVQQVEAARSAPAAEQAARLWALLDDSPRPWLLFLDDAGDTAVGNPNWVHRSRAGAVVVTSRSGPDGWGADALVTRIGELGPDDGAQVLLDRLGDHPDPMGVALARDLARDLAGMPLALASAGRLAASAVGRPMADLVASLRAAATRGPLPAVYEVGLQTGRAVAQSRALLRLLACFAPDEPLPLRILGDAAALGRLVEAGLVEELPLPHHGSRCVRVHPAIAEHSRRDAAFDADVVGRMAEHAVSLLRAELARLDAGLAADWPSIWLLEPHVAAIVEGPLEGGADMSAALLELADATAEALVRAGRQRAATALLDTALDATKRLGESHPARLGARRTAAWMMAFDRDLRTAEQQLQDLVEDAGRWLGAEHPHTLAARDCAAWLRAERGAVEEGRAELGRILVVRSRVLGEEHPATLSTRQRLAWVSALCRREQYAADQLREVLRIRLAAHGPDHLDVFSTRYRLAWVLVRQGELAQAEGEFRALHDDLRRVVGDRHPLALMVRTRIAWVLKRRKRFTAARRTYTEVLADQVYVLGHGHQRVLRTQHLLACLDLQLGRTADAVRALRVVVADREAALGPDHHDTLVSRSYLAWALLRAGDAAAADREFSAVLADRIRIYGPRHRLTLMTRDLHGRVLVKRGLLHEAERRLERLHVDELNLLGPDDRLAFETRHALAVIAAHLGRLDECESGLRAVLADRQRVLGADHPDTLATRDYLAWALGLQGRLTEAEALCSAVVADRQRVLGGRHPHTLHSRYHAAWLAGHGGRWDESLALARALLAELGPTLGEQHPDTLRCRLWIARAMRFTGELDGAERRAQDVVVAQTRVQGSGAVDTLRAREEHALILDARGAREQAAAAFEALRQDRREALEEHHPDTVRSFVLCWEARSGQ